jgi:DNA-binding transcriptional MocR family regulator
MSKLRYRAQPETKSILDRGQRRWESSIHDCLAGLGISLLSEWDILAFVYRHSPTLTSTEQIAKLIGYESGAVGAALDRLEREKLIERVGPSQGVRLHRILPWTHVRHQRCLQRLVSPSESRAGRLLLKKLLKPAEPEAGQSDNCAGPESEGKRYD